MSAPTGLSAGSNPSWSLSVWNKVHRYRCLLLKYWWVVLLTLSVTLCVTAYFQMNKPTTFSSSAKLSVNVENRQIVAGDQNAGLPTDVDSMIQTQLQILQTSADVRRNASDSLQASYPDMPASPVSLEYSAKNTIVTVTATGPNPLYTQRYLQATIDGYLNYRKKVREDADNAGFGKLHEQIAEANSALKQDNEAIIQYQREINTVFGAEDDTNKTLEALRLKHDTLQSEYNQLLLMTPEQGIDRSSAAAANVRTNPAGNNNGGGVADLSPTTQIALDLASTQTDYRQALATIADLKVQLDEFSKDMRDRHPKIVSLRASIDSQQRRVNDALAYAAKRIESQREFSAKELRDLEARIKAAEPKALEDRMQRAKFDQLGETKKRDQDTYTSLMKTSNDAAARIRTTPETISVMEPASPASAILAPWIKPVSLAGLFGLALGIGILFLIDRLDDRMATISDFQMHFAEHVLGQIPRDNSGDSLELLKPEDTRHQLVESFRNLRSTLLFMPLDGARPKTLLITSAVPNEGKSTTSSNLALVLASAGMKTLLIDADLRRGAIHGAFGVPRDPGLTDVLGHNVNWKLAIRTTGVENLHVLPRGRNVPQPSEYLLNKATDRLLAELYPLYDYIVIDSSPVLAADDTASLAPKIDATLFVTRMGFTSAKMTRKSLEILYKRQANIPGVILNQVDTSSPEFVYYQYEEYYAPASDEDEAAHTARRRKVKVPAKSAEVS